MRSNSNTIPFVLTIGGSDSNGAVGIQADLKTFQAHNIYGLCAITIVTAQNSDGIQASRVMEADFVLAQIQATTEVPISAVKIGLLLTTEIVETVGKGITAINAPLIIDPVLAAGDGHRLTDDRTVQAYKEILLPKSLLVTPNADEAEILTGITINDLPSMREAATMIRQFAPNVLIKGRHLTDIFYDGTTYHELTSERLPVTNPRGAGDTYSAAISVGLARGDSLGDAIHNAKQYVTATIRAALDNQLKSGSRDVLLHISNTED